MMLRPAIHLALHFLAPAVAARIGYASHWRHAWLVMMSTMLVDLDHLLANPLYDPNRCSMGFHPLHTWFAVGVYVALLAIPRMRLIAIGLLIHMGLDTVDCAWMGTLPLL